MSRAMRWDCGRDGCFKDKKLLRLGVFEDCFPRDIGMTDLDGMVEVNGRGLLLEWKAPGASVPTGQRIAFERLTATGLLVVFCVEGDEQTMAPESLEVYWMGKGTGRALCDLDGLKARIRAWVDWTST